MAFSVSIHGRDMAVSTRLRQYVEKKVNKLDRYLPSITEVRVELAEIKSARSAADRNVAQLTVLARGAVFRAEESKDDMFAAVDAALDKMQRQLTRYKDKHTRGRGDGIGAEAVAAPPDEESAPLEPHGHVVRRKRFTLTPMNEAEALEQMHQLGHDENFFVFYNAETNRVNVLYRRRGGGFGLIDPEIG